MGKNKNHMRFNGLARAVTKAQQVPTKSFPIQLPQIPNGVVPVGQKSAIATDSNFGQFANVYSQSGIAGFPGYPYLSMLATRAEYRAASSALSTELTREWISINSSETAGDDTKDKVTQLSQKIAEIGLQQVIQRAAEHDCQFGRAQIFINLKGHNDLSVPLIIDPRTIKRDSFVSVTTVEAMWTTPSAYNAIDPTAPDFYKPSKWFMLGKEVHASRLLTVVTRPLPDMLKAAFNFGGMSLSQLGEGYVNRWLRTVGSVADLIENFSITALKTRMDQVLAGDDDGDDLFKRAELFVATRSNKGLQLLDSESEDLIVQNVPLGGLHELQSQSQEHLCSVWHIPAVILTGIDPAGLNASSEGQIKTFYDWIAALQEAYWRVPINTILQVLQISMFGNVDPDISFNFQPLYQMTEKELAEVRTADANRAGVYIDRGVIDPSEERERIARDPTSGYQGLDMSLEIVPEADDTKEEEDK